MAREIFSEEELPASACHSFDRAFKNSRFVNMGTIRDFILKSSVSDTEPGISTVAGKAKEPNNTIPFYKLFTFADSWDKILMIVGTIGAIGSGLAQPLMTLIFGELIDVFGKANKDSIVSEVSKVVLKYIYLALGCGTAAFLQVACWMITGERQTTRIRSLYLTTILQQDIAYFDREVSTGEVIGRMSGDTILIQDAIGEKVGKLIQVVTVFVGGFVIAFTKGWRLSLVMLPIIPFIVMSSGMTYFIRSKMAKKIQNAYVGAANVVQQAVGSIRTVASLTGENKVMSEYKKFLKSSYKSDVVAGTSAGFGTGFVRLIVLWNFGLGVWVGAKMVLQEGYTGGQVFTILLAVIIGSNILGQGAPSLAAFATAQAAAAKMFETMNRKPTIDAYDNKGKILDDIRGDIELRDVCFSYPSRPKEQIFTGFCLFIPSGSTTALVGNSGSGKSTVIGLIERFYEPLGGQVLIDDVDLREIQIKWIRSKIGLVSQEPVLFAGSIRDNIGYGKDGASLEEINDAALSANAYDLISKLPQGFDTVVGENGVQLSGGQKQRVAIARAILKDPRILLLDEATSALDIESERIVQGALEKAMVNRTTLIVAHRLSTIRNADMIAVLYQGKIVERVFRFIAIFRPQGNSIVTTHQLHTPFKLSGTHLELLSDPQGVYSNLINSQEINKNEEGKQDANIIMTQPDNILYSQTTSYVPKERSICNEPSEKLPMYRLAYLNRPEAAALVVGAVFASIYGAIHPVYGLLLSSSIKTYNELPHQLKKDSVFWALMFVFLGAIHVIVYPSMTYLFSVAGMKLIKRVRVMCFEKIVNMEIEWFDRWENSSGAIGARLSTDAYLIRSLVGDFLAELVQGLASVVVGLGIACAASWQLALIVFATIPLLIFNGYVQMRSVRGFSRDAKLMYEEASQVANEAVTNIRTVASFCAQEKVRATYNKKCKQPALNGAKQGLINGIGFGLSICLFYSVFATIFYAGARLFQDGKATSSDVFRVFYALATVAFAISSTSSFAPDWSKAKNAVASVFAILDRKSKVDPSDESGITLECVVGEIEFDRVNFSYPTRPSIQILRDLSLTINSGKGFENRLVGNVKVVALVGESGSGKSTVISLLERFYDPDSGRILLDGIEINKFPVKWLRQQMGLVSQEPILFNNTIQANIASGKVENATESEIIAAAKLANAHQFICGLQQGYDTMVGERGVQLSGGQKQRVAIARAILKSPKILLLDEATSALDVESEKIVEEALDKVMLNRTTIVIAHRLSTIRGADVIAVFKNGSIVEKGNHNALIGIKDGLYSSLVNLHTTCILLLCNTESFSIVLQLQPSSPIPWEGY
ncbi:ABC transporter B family member [Striga asiatica]|uniref:ABC transporter B family member n=1 Tax=Striga asiatica TaxID=4170 RepID=A0A5A7P540_STRAF|nr:ABC transporter B family member [Striga asiatica]